MKYNEIKQQALLEAQRLHDEWLARHFGNEKDSDVVLEVEKHQQNDFQKLLYEGLLAPDQVQEILAQILYVSLKERTTNEWLRPNVLVDSFSHSTSGSQASTASSESVSYFIEDYLQSRDESGKSVSKETNDKKRTAINEFVVIIGNLPLCEVDVRHAENFRRILRCLPPNRSGSAKYKGKTVIEILDLELPEELCFSPSHIKRTLGELKSYFKWLCNRKLITINPFEDVTVVAKSKSYVRFSDEDLATLLKQGVYSLKDDYTTVSRWWLILLGLYTGARIGELCQLRLDDVIVIDDVLCLSITDEEEAQKLKTEAAKRKMPVHQDLLKLGFEDYLRQVRATGSDRLLPTAWSGTGKAGKTASTWFGRYRRARFPHLCGHKKVFHSFRTTFIQVAMEAGVDMSKLQQMVGHEPSLLGSTKTYIGDGFPVTMLSKELEKVSFDSIDLDWLKANSWRDVKKP